MIKLNVTLKYKYFVYLMSSNKLKVIKNNSLDKKNVKFTIKSPIRLVSGGAFGREPTNFD